MPDPTSFPRRGFLGDLSSVVLGGATFAACSPASTVRIPIPGTGRSLPAPTSANDRIQVAAIGLGIMGFNNCDTLRELPGVELVAGCDAYSGRLLRAKEKYGTSVRTTRDHRELLEAKDIDAVIISTPDHLHESLTVEALRAGKAVYLEKPMVRRIEEGHAIIRAQKETGSLCQIGSQRVSSAIYDHARRLYAAGEIGKLVAVEAHWDRHSALGAWQYSIPRDASPATVSWKRFLGPAPRRAFDAMRFFRWRNYQDYGTGVAGDLFVHLFSGLHVITGSLGPTRIYASGGLHYWKDGRDVADVMIGLYDYPRTKTHEAFHLQLRVNLADGGGGGQEIALVGTEGKMLVTGSGVRLSRHRVASAPGYGGWDSHGTFDEKNRRDYVDWYDATFAGKSATSESSEAWYAAEEGYSDHRAHHANFIGAIRGAATLVEDPTFGLRAAAPALASNLSSSQRQPVEWNPQTCA